MSAKPFNKLDTDQIDWDILAEERLGQRATIKVTPSCGCVFCDLKCSLFYDEDGEYFFHDGPEDMRIRCDVSNTMDKRPTLLEFAKSGGPIIGGET